MDAEEDRKSPRNSNQTNEDTKESLGMIRSLQRSIQRAAEKSPLSPKSKGSKVTPKTDTKDSWSLSSLQPPLSPNHNIVKLGDSFIKSIKSIKKKANDRTSRHESPITVSEGSAEVEKEEEEEVLEEKEESYTLPEIPHIPLSVMQISRLIEMEELEEGYLNILALRQEFQRENQLSSKDTPIELSKKEKDLSLLYGDLRKKVVAIVRDSNSLPSRNKILLQHVVRIIQEEERRAEEAGGLPDSWMEAWREAVAEGVRAKVESVHLESQEHNTSWLAVHLGLLGKVIVEDLESVRRKLRWSYPSSFNVLTTYVSSYHRVVGQHLRKLEQRATELRDLHALLDWIVNTYKSERIMGSVSLQPDMQAEHLDLQLEDGFLTEVKERYCCRAKGDIKSALNQVINVENEDFWSKNRPPDMEDEFLLAEFPMDIWRMLEGKFLGSRKIDAQLEQKVTTACLEEVKQFPTRFEVEFRRHCSSALCMKYQITYINSFTVLQKHIESYQDACPEQVEGFRNEVKWLIVQLLQSLEDQFKEDVKAYLRRMMTRKWLTNDEDFDYLYTRTEQLSEHCGLMRPPHAQELASGLHYHVVSEYVGQLMRNNYRCRNRKHETAAKKLSLQWNKLKDLFKDMGSSYEWLDPVGDDLSNIIGTETTEIKDNIWPLVLNCPDFSKKHLMAVLDFRGLRRGREHRLIVQHLSDLKDSRGSVDTDQRRVLFRDMPVTVNTDCLSNLPLSCLNFMSSR